MKNYQIFILIFVIALVACQQREWDNPFDPDCPKELFSPSNVQVNLTGNQVNLSWQEANSNISGFVIEKSVSGGTWASIANLDKSAKSWSDPNLSAGKVHSYRITAKAGNNASNPVTTEITPLFSSTLATNPVSKLLSTSVILGGNVTNDGGANVTARGVCWSTSSNPTTSNSKTSDGSGTGTYTSTLTGLATNSTYYARAYATNSTGTSYGNEISFKTYFGEVTDIDGNVYLTVKIGSQIWMAENLKTTKYNDGTAIPNITDNTQWAGLTTGAYCWYNNDVNNKNVYGALYNWYAVNTNKLAPVGWHVPTDAEWTTLTDYLGGDNVAGGKLKETGTSHWQSPNTSATNESGFNALPGGFRSFDISYGFKQIQNTSVLWYNTAYDLTNSWINVLYYNSVSLIRTPHVKNEGIAVRCILGVLSLPTITTSAISEITFESAVLGGNVTSDGNSTVTERGIVLATSQNPTTSNTKLVIGSGIGSFSNSLAGLAANTTYYVRAYAINSSGTGYGNQVSFTTNLSLSLPTIMTSPPAYITSSSVTIGGNITSDGNSTVTERGIVFATSQNPTTSNTKVSMGSGIGNFFSNISGLTPNTTYFLRAYAINTVGTAYGYQYSFITTQTLSLSTLTTNIATNITSSGVTLGGNISSDGNSPVTERGVVYATTQNPTTSNAKIVSDSGAGGFSTSVTDLTPNTTYYARAFATNSLGTAYGNQVSFTTTFATRLSMSRSNLNALISLSAWHYIAITKSSDLTGNLYIDGVLVSSSKWESQNYNYQKLIIGYQYDGPSFYYGLFDEFRMSNKVRTSTEILNYYQSVSEFQKDINTIGLWHFNESSGNSFTNSVTGIQSGILDNGATFVDGKFGKCVSFDGISGGGDCNTDIPESNITFEFWIKFFTPQNSTVLNAWGAYNSHVDLNK